MATTYRIRQTRGTAWVEHVDAAGRPSITAFADRAKRFPTRDSAERAVARFPRGLVPVRVVEGG